MKPAGLVEALVAQANMERDAHNWQNAARLYALALRKNLTSTEVWVQYAHMLKESEYLDEAVEAYRCAIRTDGTAVEPRIHCAHLLKRLYRTNDAIEAFVALSSLPDAPPVQQELAALEASTEQSNAREYEKFALRSPSDQDRALFDDLRRAEQARLSERFTPTPRAIKRFSNLISRKPEFSRLNPKANLVIRDGVFVATTNDPQFEILCDSRAGETGWYVCVIEIQGDISLVEPILYIETDRNWSSFHIRKLEPIGRGVFQTFFYLDSPPLRMRLDPLTIEGTFEVPHFSLRTCSWRQPLKRALSKKAAATCFSLLQASRHASLAAFGLALSAILKYPGMDSYSRWRLLHDQAPSHRQQSDFLPIDVLILAENRPSAVDDTEASLRQSRMWNVINTNAVASNSSDDNSPYVLIIKAGNLISPYATERIAAALAAAPDTDLLYGDEDEVDTGGVHRNPRFKPDWNIDYFYSANYIGGAFVVRRSLLNEYYPVDGPVSAGEVLQRVVLAPTSPRIKHIPFILTHRAVKAHEHQGELLPINWNPEEEKALEKGLQRLHPGVSVTRRPHGLLRVCWPIPTPAPRVSLIIPTKNHANLLKNCVDSIFGVTDYQNFELIIVDNGSDEAAALGYLDSLRGRPNIKILTVPGPFNFSRLNNLAVSHAEGQIIGLINNDIVVKEPGWLSAMVSHAIRPNVGAVGALLVYESGAIQHAGMVCGIGLLAGHPHKYRRQEDPGYMGRILATQRLSAVTGACLLVEKDKYINVAGLDEDHLPVAFNDLDLCLKLEKAGFHTIYEPSAVLYHLESVSRGFDTTKAKAEAYRREANFMLQKWGGRVTQDPFYNPNLTPLREDYSLAD